eukprot:COSAG01_NODE_33917_length_556_cov_1.387309_2_plen_54_part_01
MPACLRVGWAGLQSPRSTHNRPAQLTISQVLSAGLLCPDKAHLFENFTWEAQAG